MFTKNSFSTDRYVTPLCETLEVKFEGVMCGSNDAGSGYDNDHDLGNL